MTLDDLARDAAARTRQEAADLGRVDLNRYRRGRQRRNGVLLGAGAVSALLTFLVVIAMSSPIEKTAVTVVTTPEIPSSTTPSPSTTSPAEPTGFLEPTRILGAGWEEIDAGPVAGRYRMAAVWTDHGLFVYGGHDNYRQETPSNSLFYHDGYLYDPETGWSALPEVGQTLFEVGEARALGMGDAVLVYGRPRAQFSNHAAIFDLTTGHWEPVAPDFGNSLGPDTDLVWTGELIVAPTLGLAYDLESGVTTEMPMPTPSVYGESSPLRGYWTGSEVVVIGSGQAQTWSPGGSAWRAQGNPGIGGVARDSVWVGGALWVVNYEMSVARWDGAGWSRPGDLPLRFFECLPEAVAVGLTPVVRTCSGMAIWDAARESWVPVPLEDFGPQIRESVVLVGGDAIYSVGGPTLRRFVVQRDETGSIIPPHTVPVGVMQLRIPSGWALVSSFAPEQSPDGTITEDETIGLVFQSGDTTCQVASTYAPGGWSPPFEATLIGDIALGPTGDLSGIAYWVHGFEDDESGVLFAVPDSNGSDWVTIRCSSPDRDSLTASAASFGYLWSPWDPPAESPEYIVGPGWEQVEARTVADRQGAAVVWTDQGLLVWGGVGPDVAGTLGPFRYRGGSIRDPAFGIWRSMTPVEAEGLCGGEVRALTVGDRVLLYGATAGADRCALAALYDTQTDAWFPVADEFASMITLDTALVWTGDWLAVPTRGIAYVPSSGETVPIPVVPTGGERIGTAFAVHWTGERMLVVTSDGAFSLVPGESAWLSIPDPPVRQGVGRVSVWSLDGLWVADVDHRAALLDEQGEWHPANLPFDDDHCGLKLITAADRVVVANCTAMAIWDPVRGYWVPLPPGERGWFPGPTLVGADDAIYSIGRGLYRYRIEFDAAGAVVDPVTIPVGTALLDLGEFTISTTIGLSQTEYPDGSVGEVVAIALDGPGGRCHVTSAHGGPALGEPERVFAPSGFLVLVFDSPNAMTDWAVRTGDGDVVRIHCESEDDALTLVQGLWGISFPQT